MSVSPIEPPTDQQVRTPENDTGDEEHPAKFSPEIVAMIAEVLREILPEGSTILDPFAGIGRIHLLQHYGYRTFAVELERGWALQAEELGPTWCGDFFEYEPITTLLGSPRFDAVVTSPTYGNRMADHHNARDGSKRVTYTHKLGRSLSENNSGAMQWGPEYKVFHNAAWRRVYRHMLRDRGLFVLNISDHIRKGKIVKVAAWHRSRAERLGFELVTDIKVPTRRMGFGENHELRVDHEHVMVFMKGDT